MPADMLTISKQPIDKADYKGFLGSCTSIKNFQKLNQLGEGTYGVVHRAVDRRTKSIVALKAVRIFADGKRDGIPNTALREISLLKSLRHQNIIGVLDVAVADRQLDEIYMVMEFAQHDLADLIDYSGAKFTVSEVKCIMKQLLEGLEYIHSQDIIHRDIKMSNLLLTSSGILKIANTPSRLWPRPLLHRPPTHPRRRHNLVPLPELLFGAKSYTSAVDLWSAGCIMGELILRAPLLPGSTEREQVDKIIALLGPPNDRIWPGFRALPLARMFRLTSLRPNSLNSALKGQSSATIDFVNELLVYDPEKRITAREALEHEYFRERPLALDPGLLPTFPPTKQVSDKIKSAEDRALLERESSAAADEVVIKQTQGISRGSYGFEFDEEDLSTESRQHKRARR
ncbi:kinase-like domain-containing protein [Myxozyma melibiosi]|uniref:Kinase-like domain-containing protein n=1 Tax=Myxozyma melibiosi TaxID=54550 RepID=A0ABR1FC20_9ASCO